MVIMPLQAFLAILSLLYFLILFSNCSDEGNNFDFINNAYIINEEKNMTSKIPVENTTTKRITTKKAPIDGNLYSQFTAQVKVYPTIATVKSTKTQQRKPGPVYHAYWPLKKKCTAFKSTSKFGGKREIQVLNYFNNLRKVNPNESNYVAEIVELKEKIAIALELGENNLRGYYLKHILNGGYYFKNIVNGNNHGIHLDIKAENFIISQEQNEGDNVIVCKLIDFNTSFLYKHHNFDDIRIKNTTDIYKAPEIRNDDKMKLTKRVDVWAFGLMSYKLLYTLSVDKYEDLDKLLNEYRNDLTKISRLDRIIKACIQVNPFKRPSMKALNNFWNKECDAFNYEKENFKNSSSKEDNNEVTLKQMRIDLCAY
uniref:Protein kinase domain-containing protein n=1 Tax=Meloidogyne floridensis TaxID=298350 RepID=A0A915NUN3_9BILA